jgi:ribosomal protein S11
MVTRSSKGSYKHKDKKQKFKPRAPRAPRAPRVPFPSYKYVVITRRGKARLRYNIRQLRPITFKSRRGRLWVRWLTQYLLRLGLSTVIRKLKYKQLPQLTVFFSKRNTIFTLSRNSHVLARVSNGSVQRAAFKKAVRKRQFPTKVAVKEMLRMCRKLRCFKVRLVVVNTGKNRKLVLRLLRASRIRFYIGQVRLGIAYGGCRSVKRRRL